MHECGVCHQTMLFTRLIGKYKDKDNDTKLIHKDEYKDKYNDTRLRHKDKDKDNDTRLIHKDEYKDKYNMCKMQKMQTIANFEQY